MRLSDIMSQAGLSGYAEIALILFFAAFVAIVARLLRPSSRGEFEKAARLPLEDEPRRDSREGA